jgi:formyltetrahydrofolate synthetase
MSLKDKIEKICKEMYGADGVDYSELAETRLAVSSLAAFSSLRLTLHLRCVKCRI